MLVGDADLAVAHQIGVDPARLHRLLEGGEPLEVGHIAVNPHEHDVAVADLIQDPLVEQDVRVHVAGVGSHDLHVVTLFPEASGSVVHGMPVIGSYRDADGFHFILLLGVISLIYSVRDGR